VSSAASASTQTSAICSQRLCVPWQRPALAKEAAKALAAAASQAARSDESALAATLARQRSTVASRTPTARSFVAAHLSAAAASTRVYRKNPPVRASFKESA
jgi:hypothetical protein